MGLAMPLAFLRRAGFQPEALDLPIEGFDDERVQRAHFIGISVPMHTALRLGVRAARRVRAVNPSCHICFYGLYATLNSEFLLGHEADSVIGGEYEEPLARLLTALDEGGDDGVEGVASSRHAALPFLKRLPFPVPLRSNLPPLANYARLKNAGEESLAGYVEASRGCKHKCLHCPVPPVYQGRFFAVPREVVLEDIRQLVSAGARHITFGDPDFLNGPTHSLKIVRAAHREFPHLTYDFTAKVEHLIQQRALLSDFARLGCIFVVSAVESLSDTVLANLEKGHNRADVLQALSAVRGSGMALRPSFVSFTPWTTLEDYLDVLDFVESEDLIDCVDPIQYAIRLLIPPGSRLLSRPQIHPYIGSLAPELFSYTWHHPDARMDDLHKKVSAMVEDAVAREEDAGVTFLRIRELGLAVANRRSPNQSADFAPLRRVRPPHLTEPWFC
jgi:radical SAM superfamily enzyme YgiQ (UPF0313 family)